MKPQLKPFSAITSEAIWASARYWVLITPGMPKIVWSKWRTLASIQECTYARRPSLQVYPCTYSHETGEIEAIPWPLLPGEVQIEEWRGLSCKFDAQVTSNWGHSYWALFTRMNDETAYETELRPGFHPSPRRQINPDGTETPVWVWEKDV